MRARGVSFVDGPSGKWLSEMTTVRFDSNESVDRLDRATLSRMYRCLYDEEPERVIVDFTK